MESLTRLFLKPSVIGVIGDVNSGKSLFLYDLLEKLSKTQSFKLYTHQLRIHFKDSQEIHTVTELEQIRDALVIIDELSSLFDLNDRKIRKQIENTLRLIVHNNNILVLCGTPENFKKFISAKLDVVFFKKVTIADMINGSRVKHAVMGLSIAEKGAEVLNIPVGEILCYDGLHWCKFKVDYNEQYDSKKENVPIFVQKAAVKMGK